MRNINTGISKEKGKLDRFFSACIGAGRAGELLRFPVMAQLERAQRECPFRYIRFHGLFHEEMNVVRRNEAGALEFSFAYTDMLFDKLLSRLHLKFLGKRTDLNVALICCCHQV